MSSHASLVVRFRMRLHCSRGAIADLWECGVEDVKAAEYGQMGDRWIEDRFWFFVGLHWLHLDGYLTKPQVLRPEVRTEIEGKIKWLKQQLRTKR